MGLSSFLAVAVAAVALVCVPTQVDLKHLVHSPSERQSEFIFQLHSAADEAFGTAYEVPGKVTFYQNLYLFAIGTTEGWAARSQVSNTWLGIFNLWIPFPVDVVAHKISFLLGEQGFEVHQYSIAGWQVIVLINIVVYLLWSVLPTSFMLANFATSVNEGLRVWSWVTSAFSHNTIGHLVHNMLLFYQVAPILEFRLGTRHLWLVYAIAGAGGSMLSLAVRAFGDRRHRSAVSLGASGVVMSLLLLFVLMFPAERFVFFGGTPVSGLVFVALHVFLDIAVNNTSRNVSSHIGSILAVLLVLPRMGVAVPVPTLLQPLLERGKNLFRNM